jgi:hypothetical protein
VLVPSFRPDGCHSGCAGPPELLRRCLRSTGLDEIGEQQPAFDHFAEAIEFGVSQYIKEKRYTANVNVSIELENATHTEEFLEDLGNE